MPPSVPLTPFTKPAISYPDQVAKLVQCGMVVGDLAAAEKHLTHIGYYRLMAYWYPFRNQATKQFHPGTNFDHIIWLYEFDRHLRLLAMDAVERIEIELRTTITQHFSMKYGPLAYVDPMNFLQGRWADNASHYSWLGHLLADVDRSKEGFVAHHREKHLNFPIVPLWAARETMTWGALSRMLRGLLSVDQQAIADNYYLPKNTLVSWVHSLNFLRNTCAHHSRLWNRDLPVAPELVKPLRQMPLPSFPYPTTNYPKRAYHYLLILRYMLAQNGCVGGWKDRAVKLLHEMDQHPHHHKSMGIDPNWATSPYWR